MAAQPYTLELATEEDEAVIEDYVNRNFYADMPMFRVFGMTELPDDLAADHHNKEDAKHLAFVVKAVSADGEIVGVSINRTKPPDYGITDKADPCLLQMFEFMEFISDDSKIKSLPEKTVELYILSVAPEWRKKGIARRLTEESVRIAKEMGFEVMKVCCANEFTMLAVRNLGFQEFYKLAYRDYSKLSGVEVTLKEFPPHDYVYFYIKYLQK